MTNDFDRILDECIDRINHGSSLDDCLSDYPEYAERLKPLLRSMVDIRKAGIFMPSVDAKRQSRTKFQAALDKRYRTMPVPAFLKFISRPAVWTAVTVIVFIAAGIWVVRPALSPPPPTGPENPPVLVSNPDGNFAFFISDEPNDIGGFENLNVTISRVSLQTAGNSGERVDFIPVIKTVDLTQLQGAQSQEIWRGNVPAGQYSQVFIDVSDVTGKLNATGQTILVKLPSSKLHISKTFEVVADKVTGFTFDITVVETGNKGEYILKPQISESGAKQ